MKQYTCAVFSFLFLLTSCSINDNNNNDLQPIVLSFWHLTNTTGGISGVDDSFELDTVVWFFDEINGSLTVSNNNTEETKEDALESGTYTFSIVPEGDKNFIIIDGIELGEITVNEPNFVINENITSDGETSDGFIYTFQRVTQTQ
jgi:hypothetical protein